MKAQSPTSRDVPKKRRLRILRDFVSLEICPVGVVGSLLPLFSIGSGDELAPRSAPSSEAAPDSAGSYTGSVSVSDMSDRIEFELNTWRSGLRRKPSSSMASSQRCWLGGPPQSYYFAT